MRFILLAEGVACGYLDLVNRLADAGVAFKLLHFLHHLNGAAFTRTSRTPYEPFADRAHHLNPTIVRALSNHYQRTAGRSYRLHFREYRSWKATDVLDALLSTTGRMPVGTTGFIRTRIISGYVMRMGGVMRMMELSTAIGNKCLKLVGEMDRRFGDAEVQDAVAKTMQVGISKEAVGYETAIIAPRL